MRRDQNGIYMITEDPARGSEEVVLAPEEEVEQVADAEASPDPRIIDEDLIEELIEEDLIEEDLIEEFDEASSPELVTLLKSEVKLLLRQSKNSHCRACCPNAYTPNIEYLDISDIKFHWEELAMTTLKAFTAVNKGLKFLGLSWSCVDNETVSKTL